jgi:peptidyl-prolyl cis-trans isomerase SurA
MRRMQQSSLAAVASIALAALPCVARVVLVCVALAGAPAQAAEQLADGIAAQVGSEVVLVSEVMRVARPAEAQMKAAGAPEAELAKVRANALEQLIESHLLARVVKQSDLHATDAEVDEAVAGIAKENGLTVEQLQASVSTHDISYKEYREQIRKELERRKVVQSMIAARVRVDEEDLKRLYTEEYSKQPAGGETVHVRQILVVFGPEVGRDKAQACALAGESLKRIRAGTAFEEVAREVSAVAPMDGGDIGWIHADSMAPWMTEALAPLEAGGVTDVIELPFGCGVMKLVERREWVPITYQAAKQRLEEQVYEDKLATEYRTWMDQLRQNTFIERRGYFADAASLGSGSLGAESDEKASTGGSGTP